MAYFWLARVSWSGALPIFKEEINGNMLSLSKFSEKYDTQDKSFSENIADSSQ